ncbi:MAG: protein phosphatase 2C domain-containing protein [Planctomycetaceae bacterium]|nr:protein phosphatase 2C domain-containing protein [Planctomycetaceae bacterium]
MSNKTSDKIGTSRMHRIIPCFHGVCASPSEEATMKVRVSGSTKGVPGVILLPGGIDHDIYLPNESITFPKEICLHEHDLRNLDCSSPDNFSFTHYGPHKQDKPTNQDFALSGHFGDDTRHMARFAILADGISNGFSFSQRGAHLSCFAAYQCLKNLYQRLSTSNQTLNERDIERFRSDLAEKINEYFSLDREHLLSVFEAEHSAPANIASQVWHKSFKDKPEKWYGNTLLVSFLSPFGGFVVYAGDGGIVLLKGGGIIKEVMRSDPTSTISRFVSMGVTGAKFLGALVGYEETDDFVEIISATDGLDRTYQLNDLDLTSIFSSDASLSVLIDQIGNIDQRVPGEVDFDNYSIGRIFLPLASRPNDRMTGNGEAVVPVALKTPDEGADHEHQRGYEPTVASVEKKRRIAA